MRCAIILAAAFTTIAAAMAVSAPDAEAQQWCGFSAKPHAIVECGYTSFKGCENSIGKGAMCFINPYLAFDEKRATPFARHSEG